MKLYRQALYQSNLQMHKQFLIPETKMTTILQCPVPKV